MARSRKKSMSQNIVGAATAGLPQPARKFLGGRIVATLIIVVVPLLFATGILSLEWVNGRPSVQFHRDKAQQVEKRAAKRVDSLRDEIAERRNPSKSLTKEANDRLSKALNSDTESR